MKKIGHEVLFLATSGNNPRNGESTFVRLPDGRILFAYTQYYGTSAADHAIARLCACWSDDEGESWSEPRLLLEKDAEAENYMSPALVRVPDGTVGLFYLRKQLMPDMGMICMPCFRKSTDNGETWSEQCRCPIGDGYYCGINDGAIVTKAGRLLWPMSYHGPRYDTYGKCTLKFTPVNEMVVLASDDCGATWRLLGGRVRSPFASTGGNLAEPGVMELEDGTLWMWMRTGLGHQYDTLSTDGGESWLPAEPNLRFPSPDSPMRVKRLGDITAAAWNPVPFLPVNGRAEMWGSPKRTPIALAISRDGAASFTGRGVSFANGRLRGFMQNVYLLEDDESMSYCYPSMLRTTDGLLVSYYHSAGSDFCLRASKIVKIYRSEIEA